MRLLERSAGVRSPLEVDAAGESPPGEPARSASARHPRPTAGPAPKVDIQRHGDRYHER